MPLCVIFLACKMPDLPNTCESKACNLDHEEGWGQDLSSPRTGQDRNGQVGQRVKELLWTDGFLKRANSEVTFHCHLIFRPSLCQKTSDAVGTKGGESQVDCRTKGRHQHKICCLNISFFSKEGGGPKVLRHFFLPWSNQKQANANVPNG